MRTAAGRAIVTKAFNERFIRGGCRPTSLFRFTVPSPPRSASSTRPPFSTTRTRFTSASAAGSDVDAALMWTDAELFRHRRAAPAPAAARVVLGVLIFFGLQSVALFAVWW